MNKALRFNIELRGSNVESYLAHQISIINNTIHKTRQAQTKPNCNKPN